jgi:hypothetical protein
MLRAVSKNGSAATEAVSIVLSSSDISTQPSKPPEPGKPPAPSFKTIFEVMDPPPTEMKITLPLWPVGASMTGSSTRTRVYLRRYVFDCLWRDSDDPRSTITSNSGTSVSKKLLITFFVGAQGTTRLIKPNTSPTATSYADVIIPRNSSLIGEHASYPYGTAETTNFDVFFENDFTNMVEYIGQPGLYIGDVDPQAVSALRASTTITVRIVTDRTDYPSPFWHYKFLTGVSLWNTDLHQYEIVESGKETIRYFQKLDSVTVTELGGPYFPTCLHRLSKPYLYDIHSQVVTNSVIRSVSDPLRGEFVITSSPNVSCWISQLGLASSDLSRLRYSTVQGYLVATSDETSFTIPVYFPDTDTVRTVTVYNNQGDENMPSRFSPYPEFSFPNGVWRGTPLTAEATASASTKSCFPFERHLTADLINILDDSLNYSIAPPTVKIDIVPNHLFLHMDGGSGWLEDTMTDSSTQHSYTAGERSLQFDLGHSVYVNKLQLIFPRSQEDYQPVRLAASLHHSFGSNIEDVQEAPLPIWFGNYQHNSPSGSQSSSDSTKGYTFLNTHTQQDNNLFEGGCNLMHVNDLNAPSEKPYSGTTNRPAYVQDRGGRSQVVAIGTDTYVNTPPNGVNPAFDFYRQEYGPFVRGCTADELFDTTLVKAIVPKGEAAVWSSQYVQGHYFTTPEDFLLTATAQALMTAAIFVIESGSVRRLTDTNNDKTTLLNASVRKYLYSVDYNDVAIPLASLTRGSFTSVADFLLGSPVPSTATSDDKGQNQWSVYLVSGSTAGSTPLQDYIVKESYYFAPKYNQYYTSPTSGGLFRPGENNSAQKMVRQEFSQGQYFGLTFGSFLNGTDSNTPRYTRGKVGNKLRLYSVRLCTQLFSFKTSGGWIVDSNATSMARFSKAYDAGILKSCDVDRANLGRKYLRAQYTTPDVVPYATHHGKAETVFIDVATGAAVDRTETLMDDNLEALNHAAGDITFDQTQPATIRADMQDDTGIGEYAFYLKAASKTPLRRFAEIQLDLVNE